MELFNDNEPPKVRRSIMLTSTALVFSIHYQATLKIPENIFSLGGQRDTIDASTSIGILTVILLFLLVRHAVSYKAARDRYIAGLNNETEVSIEAKHYSDQIDKLEATVKDARVAAGQLKSSQRQFDRVMEALEHIPSIDASLNKIIAEEIEDAPHGRDSAPEASSRVRTLAEIKNRLSLASDSLQIAGGVDDLSTKLNEYSGLKNVPALNQYAGKKTVEMRSFELDYYNHFYGGIASILAFSGTALYYSFRYFCLT